MHLAASLWLALVAAVASPVLLGPMTGGAAGLAYVTSGSMEPTLQVGDGFLVWPAGDLRVGDIVVYRPVVLKAERITHRIVAVTPDGYVTRGDNSPATDQAAGEPPVAPGRILGRALTWQGWPLRLPGVGPVSTAIRAHGGTHLRAYVAGLMGLSVVLLVRDLLRPRRRRPPPTRRRVGDVYRGCAAAVVLALVLAIYLGSGVRTVEYLVSTEPGTQPNHVQLGRRDSIRLTVHNAGLVPVYHFSASLTGGKMVSAPDALPPRTESSLEISVPPRAEPGWYREYIEVYHYPPLLPRAAIGWLHRQSPIYAGAALAAVLAGLLALLSVVMDLRLPLAARREGLFTRRLRRSWQRHRRATQVRR